MNTLYTHELILQEIDAIVVCADITQHKKTEGKWLHGQAWRKFHEFGEDDEKGMDDDILQECGDIIIRL